MKAPRPSIRLAGWFLLVLLAAAGAAVCLECHDCGDEDVDANCACACHQVFVAHTDSPPPAFPAWSGRIDTPSLRGAGLNRSDIFRPPIV